MKTYNSPRSNSIPTICSSTAAVLKAREIVQALGGLWRGAYGMVRCPAHDDRTPTLAVRDGEDGRLLTHCHAGCDPVDVWSALKGHVLVPERGFQDGHPPRRRAPMPPQQNRDDNRQSVALRSWREARPGAGEPLEAYLQGRSITIPIPPTLRYHPGLRYGGSGLLVPCMVAAVQAPDGRFTAIHRTFIREDGRDKAGVDHQKMTLGPLNAGAVRLGPAGPVLGLAEGIETALSAMQIFDLPTWAALGLRFVSVTLPPEVREVHLFADNCGPGRAAAEKAVQGFTAQRRRCVLRFPQEPHKDWNDFLQHGT